MVIIIVLIIIFLVLLFLPIGGALIYYATNKGEILHIKQDRVRDPRYFGKSFASLIEQNYTDSEVNEITLSKKEEFMDIDELDDEYIDNLPFEIDKLVISKNKDFTLKNTKFVNKEIYAGYNLILDSLDLSIRAAYSKVNMIVGSNTNVVRWLDAEGTLAIYDNCNLGISVSSGTSMSIGHNCKFRRIYCPEIYLGQYPHENNNPTTGKDPRIYRLPVQLNSERNIKYISNESINEEGLVDFSVLSWDNVSVTENIIVQGDIRSHKGVRLCENSVVIGNVFAEKDVILEKNACVLGSVFSQENIILENGAVVGQKGRICSVIARGKITFKGRNFVYGYISCENTGEISLSLEQTEIFYKGALEFKQKSEPVRQLKFVDSYDYEHVDQQGFRYNDEIITVDIPDKVLNIKKSMFYMCTNLEMVNIPASIIEIDEYSFAGCKSLTQVNFSKLLNLESIGISAFEACSSLIKVDLSSSVHIIEAAAFSGCSSLTEFTITKASSLEYIMDHAFRGCSKLKSIYIPIGVKNIGVSAFYECHNLESVYLPHSLRNEPGIKTLSQDILDFY